MRSLSDLFRNFLQLGYVTDDIDAAAAYLESSMGTGKCVRSYASSLGGGLPPNLEVIRPVDGAVGLYRDAVRPGEPATLHHVGFTVDDFDEASAVVAASGRSWAQFGDSGDIRFGYLDMRAELGHFVEVMELGQPAAQWLARIDAASAAA